MASQNIQNIQNRTLPNSPFTKSPTLTDNQRLQNALAGFTGREPIYGAEASTDLGQGVPLAQGAIGEISKNAPQATYTAAPKAATPQESAAYMKQLAQSLGIKGPQDTTKATRRAAFGNLDREAYMGSLRDMSNLSAQGQDRGARSQALSVLRGTELAGKKAQTEADIQQDFASKLADYQRAMMGGAQQQGQFQTQMGAQEASRRTQASENNARMVQAQQQMRAATQMQAAGMISDEEYRRKMAEYEAALNQIQQANTADMLEEQSRQARKDRWTGIGTQMISTAGDIASAAIGA